MRARSRLEQCCDIGDDLSTLHPAILVGSRRFVLCSFRLAHGDPEALPTAVIAKAERDWIIGGIERLINGNHAVLPAGTARPAPRAPHPVPPACRPPALRSFAVRLPARRLNP